MKVVCASTVVCANIDNDKILFVPAQHRYHELCFCRFSQRGFIGVSPHANEDAAAARRHGVADMDANSTASRNLSVVQKRKLALELR